jgi:Eukaryotic rRNA processing protein EBP2
MAEEFDMESLDMNSDEEAMINTSAQYRKERA